jgi:H/ACA ribonucleoprotein complex subunit 4
VGVYSLKGEIIGLGQAAMTRSDVEQNSKGIAFVMSRLIMRPGTYPKAWRTKGEQAIIPKVRGPEVDLDRIESETETGF